jgi:hypothetical protein
MKIAAFSSPPGGLVVSMRRYSCIHWTAKFEYCCARSHGIASEARELGLGWDCAGDSVVSKANEMEIESESQLRQLRFARSDIRPPG